MHSIMCVTYPHCTGVNVNVPRNGSSAIGRTRVTALRRMYTTPSDPHRAPKTAIDPLTGHLDSAGSAAKSIVEVAPPRVDRGSSRVRGDVEVLVVVDVVVDVDVFPADVGTTRLVGMVKPSDNTKDIPSRSDRRRKA